MRGCICQGKSDQIESRHSETTTWSVAGQRKKVVLDEQVGKVTKPVFFLGEYAYDALDRMARDGQQRGLLRRAERQHGAFGELTCIDLFSGAGGLAEGFRQAGWRVLAAVDSDPFAAETFKLNFRRAAFLNKNITCVRPETLLEKAGLRRGQLGCLLGGPPCQSFSYNNHARSASTRRARLFQQYLRIVAKLRPKTLVMENVPGMLTIGGGKIVTEIQAKLAALGYKSAIKILFAEDFGVPQERRRVFIVATRLGAAATLFPRGTHGPAVKPSEEANPWAHRWTPRNGKPPRRFVTVWDAIGDLPPARNGDGKSETRYRRMARTEYQARARRGSRVINDHVAHHVTKRMLKRIATVPEGGNWRDIPRRLLPAGMKRARKSDHTMRYGRLARRGLCCTILTKCDPHWGRYIHPVEDRTITVREAARLQSFPDRFRFSRFISKQYEQIGNAVPPAMAKRIAQTLKGHIRRSVARRAKRRGRAS
jgi:DNA (cytosine-5)-methyltransferase 1